METDRRSFYGSNLNDEQVSFYDSTLNDEELTLLQDTAPSELEKVDYVYPSTTSIVVNNPPKALAAPLDKGKGIAQSPNRNRPHRDLVLKHAKTDLRGELDVETLKAIFKRDSVPNSPVEAPRPSLLPETHVSRFAGQHHIEEFAVAIANTVADYIGGGDDVVPYYHLHSGPIKVNLDRAIDRLIPQFTEELQTELWRNLNAPGRKVLQQILDLLKESSVSRCILERIAPGMTRRSAPLWLAKQSKPRSLSFSEVVHFWIDQISRVKGNLDFLVDSLDAVIVGSCAFQDFARKVKYYICSDNFVQMNLMESAMWDITMRRPRSLARDGFNAVQWKFDWKILGLLRPTDTYQMKIGEMISITGTPNESYACTITQYVSETWKSYGPFLLELLEGEISHAQACLLKDGQFRHARVLDFCQPRGGPGWCCYCPITILGFRLTISVCSHSSPTSTKIPENRSTRTHSHRRCQSSTASPS
jgi:hypothetical protein